MQAVMSLAEHVYVLAEGRIIAEGTPAEPSPAIPHVVEALSSAVARQARMTGGLAHVMSLPCPWTSLHRRLWRDRSAARHQPCDAARRGRRRPRLQRRRQVHAEPHDLRCRAAWQGRTRFGSDAISARSRQPSSPAVLFMSRKGGVSSRT